MIRLNFCEELVKAVRSTLCDVRHFSKLIAFAFSFKLKFYIYAQSNLIFEKKTASDQLAGSYQIFMKLFKIIKMYS